MNNEDLEHDINVRNFGDYEAKCSVVHTYSIKNNTQKIAIIEVSATLYSIVRKNNNKIFIGHQCCRAFDDLNLKPCVKCGRFGHSWKKCVLKCCLKCGGEHEFHARDQKSVKYIRKYTVLQKLRRQSHGDWHNQVPIFEVQNIELYIVHRLSDWSRDTTISGKLGTRHT